MWSFWELVLGIKELGESHQGVILEVLYLVLEEYNLTQKVSNIFLSFLILYILTCI